MAGTGTPECKNNNPTKSNRARQPGPSIQVFAHLPEESMCLAVKRHGQVLGGKCVGQFVPSSSLFAHHKQRWLTSHKHLLWQDCLMKISFTWPL